MTKKTERPYTCAALNASGTRCRSLAVPETGNWRCAKHADWYAHATKEEREKLALLEIEETLAELGPYVGGDGDTRRRGYTEGRSASTRSKVRRRASQGGRRGRRAKRAHHKGSSRR